MLSAGDEQRGVGEVAAGRLDREATVERDLARRDREPVELGNGLGEQFALIRGTDLACGRQDQPAGAAACVRCQFGELEDIAELVALAQLALADRPGVGVGEREGVRPSVCEVGACG